MKRDIYFYLAPLMLVAIAVLGYFVFSSLGILGYKYTTTIGGVDFVSNYAQPASAASSIASSGSFIISPQFVEKGVQNTYMTPALTMFTTVLASESKDVTIVARIVDANGNTQACQSNLGNVKTIKQLSPAECSGLLGSSPAEKIYIELPDPKLPAPRAVFQPGALYIYPTSYDNISSVTYTVLKSIFPNAQDAISRVNAVLGRLK